MVKKGRGERHRLGKLRGRSHIAFSWDVGAGDYVIEINLGTNDEIALLPEGIVFCY